MQPIKVRANQSLFDIAIEQYGSVAGVFWLVVDNDLNGVTSNVYAGDVLLVRADAVNAEVKDYFDRHKVATASISRKERAVGVGYWTINVDFVVS